MLLAERFVVLFHFLAVFPTLDGFPGSNFVAKISQSGAYQGPSNEIENWNVQQIQGFKYTKSKDFEATVFGVYAISYAVKIKNEVSGGIIQACIGINKESKCHTLVSEYNQTSVTDTDVSLHASGIIKLFAGEGVSVRLVSRARWILKPNSVFFSYLLHEYGMVPAFHVYPSAEHVLKDKQSQLIQRWEASKVEGSFMSTQSFSQNFGVFSITTTGVYYIGLNVIFRKYGGEDKYRVILRNSNDDIAGETLDAKTNVNSVTLCVSTIVELKRGTKLYMFFLKDGTSVTKILPTSSFSVAMLRKIPQGLHGFSMKTLYRQGYPNGSKIDFTKFTHRIKGGFNTILTGKRLTYSTGNYILCFNFQVHCSRSPKCSLSFLVNGLHILPKVIGDASDVYISRCASILLKSDHRFNFEIQANSFYWFLEPGSTLSLVLLQEWFPAFNLAAYVIDQKINVWIKVRELSASLPRSRFILSDGLEKGVYIVRKTGVYQINSNVIFTHIEKGASSACIAINDNPESNDGLFATSTAATGTHTLLLSSAVYLIRNQRISLYVKHSGYGRWDVDPDTILSVMYLGEKDLLIGFHTTLLHDITHKSTGWRTSASWNKPSYITSKPWSFASEVTLSRRGEFFVQYDGLYHISANVILGNANLIPNQSMFIAMVTVNDDTGSALLFTRQSGKMDPDQNDIRSDITFSLSGVLRLKKQDVVALKTCSKADALWKIRKQTGISVVLISRLAETTGFLAHSRNFSNSASSNELYGNWTFEGHDPKLFNDGIGASVHNEVISVNQPGIYLLSLNARIVAEAEGDMLLGIFQLSSNNKIICAKNSQLSKETFISCNLLLNLESGDRMKIFVSSANGKRRFSVGSASLSVLKMVRPRQYPWFYAELQESLNLYESMHLKDWNTYSRGSGSLLGHTGIEYLREEKHSKPVLRGNILVTTNLMFDDIANGRYNVSLSEPGANTSASLIYQFDSTKRFNKAVVSASHVINTFSNGLEISIDAKLSFIDRRSSFSMSYLVPVPNADILHLYMTSDETTNVSRTFSLSQWSMINTKRKLSSVVIKRGLIYFVSVQIIAEFTTDVVQLSICDKKSSALKSWLLSRHTLSNSSYTLSGLFKAAITSEIQILVQLDNLNTFKLMKGSRIDLVPIGKDTEIDGVIASLKHDGKRRKSFMFSLITRKQKFLNGMRHVDDTWIIRRSGIYLISTDVSISVRERALFEVVLTVNGELNGCIHLKQEILLNGTISFVNSLYLQRGMFINLWISMYKETSFEILPISTFGIAKLNDLDYEIDNTLLPVAYRDIFPYDKRTVPMGHPLSLKCYIAADGKIIYNWFRNGSLVASHESDTITLDGSADESGEYYCEASASNAVALSKPVTIHFYDVNECIEGSHTCTGTNQTCINTPGAYKCGCDAGFIMENGKCTGKHSDSDAQKNKKSIIDLPVAAIVLAPIAISVCIFIAIVAIYTCYKNKKAAAQRLLNHSGSFSEQAGLHRDDELSIDHQEVGFAPSEIELSGIEQYIPTNDTNKEPKEVKFSLETESDYDDDSTMDLRDEEYLSSSSI